MSTRGVNVDERAVGGDGPVRRPRAALLAAVTVALAAGLLTTIAAPAAAASGAAATALAATSAGPTALAATGAGPTALAATSAGPTALAATSAGPTALAATGAGPTALAATSVTPPPAESIAPPAPGRPGAPSPTPSTQPAAAAPTIADPGDVTSSTARFHGTGTPRHGVRVTGPASTGSTGCAAVVQPNGSWSCLGTVRSGPQQVFSVRDTSAPALPIASAPASDVIVPPTIASGGPTSGAVAGSGFRGSTVILSVAGSSAQQTARVGPDGRWVASLPARADGPVSVTASQVASTASGYRSDLRSASSAPVTVIIDRTPPAPPRVTSPGDGDRVRSGAVVVRGTGERGAGVTVYVDRAPVCRAEVAASGAWSCSSAGSTLRPGPHELTATQHDAAGNYSKSSTGVQVVVATSGSGTTGKPGATGPGTPGTTGTTGSPASGKPRDDGTADGSTSGSDDPTGTGTAGSQGGTGAGGPGSSTGPDGGTTAAGGTGTPAAIGGGHGDWSGPAGDWTAATAYDGTVPTIQTAFSWRTVLVATAVAAGFLVLIAAPLAVVAAVARGRIRSPFAGLLGRNRARTDRTTSDDVLPTWVSIGLAVTVATLCTLLGVGVALEARYVRLAIAVLLGTAVLTAAVVFATRWAAGSDHRSVGFRVSPWLVLAALVACGITRAADLSPALIVGVVLVPSGRPDLGTGPLRLGSGIAAGARSATWRTIGLLGLAAVGWVLHSLTTGDGFWASLASEFAITLCVGGVGAVVASLLPLAGSAGSAVLAASRGRYVALSVVAVALTAAVYSGSTGTHASPVLLGAVAGGCVAAAAGVWIWARTTRRDAPA